MSLSATTHTHSLIMPLSPTTHSHYAFPTTHPHTHTHTHTPIKIGSNHCLKPGLQDCCDGTGTCNEDLDSNPSFSVPEGVIVLAISY